MCKEVSTWTRAASFDNDLIALVNLDLEGASVWRIKSNGTATNLASFPPHIHFEGVITLTNDPARWGPWAGKIITGSEEADITTRNLIRAIDTNGVVSTFDMGIVSLNNQTGHDDGLSTEHFDLIPPGQDLYLAISSGQILKLSSAFFTNYVGDLLITQGGNTSYVGEPELYIVHWNGSDFISRGIPLKFYSGNTLTGFQELEGATFAPVSLPAH